MASRTKKRKAQKLPFNVLVVGKSGTGKSTFVRSFVEKDLIPPRDYDQFNDLTDRTVDITIYTEELEGDDQKIALTLIDTPGFGDNVNNSKSYIKILEYVENQHKRFLAEESRVVRNPKFQDTRVHVVLYFIPPTGHQLQELDVVFMNKLAKRVNILPVIGKADTLTASELKSFKKRIMDDINSLGIPIFDFPVNSDDDEDIVQENKEFKALLPFSIIASDDIKDGKRVRQYPWGVSEVSNESHCDFEKLATVLLSSHLEELKEKTHNELYEAYREESLKRGVEKIEQELLDAEKLEKEQKEKESADRARRIALKQEKLKKILSEDGDVQSASDDAKKKKAKPKKAEGEAADDKDEEKKKKKKKKEGKEGEED